MTPALPVGGLHDTGLHDTGRPRRRWFPRTQVSVAVSLLLLAFVAVCALLPGVVAPNSTVQDILLGTTQAGTAGHLLGTDNLPAPGSSPSLPRVRELALWRAATTVVACDPYGLTVTAAGQGLQPLVTISTRDALFTEDLESEQERQLRAFIQEGFRDEAAQSGIETRLRAFGIADLRTVLAAGGAALVLVDTLLVTGDRCPHWIFAHGLHHDAAAGEHFLIHDPWTEWEQGESWADAYHVPVTADALDKLAWTGDPAVRAMVTFT